MNLFKPAAESPGFIEFRRKIQIMGRKHFVYYWGVLGWGGPMFICTTLWDWYAEFGWRIPALRPIVFFDILFRLILWPVAGYFFGASFWKRLEGKGPCQERLA